jgi:hypothetical protein
MNELRMHLESTTGARKSAGAASLKLEDIEEHIVTLARAEVAAPEDGRTPPSSCEMVYFQDTPMSLRT